jgi:hypothetical protein
MLLLEAPVPKAVYGTNVSSPVTVERYIKNILATNVQTYPLNGVVAVHAEAFETFTAVLLAAAKGIPLTITFPL